MIIDKQQLKTNIFNGGSIEEFTSLFVWAIIGLFFSVLIELLRHKNKIKRTGAFSLGFYIKDNLLRFITSLLAILIGINFNDDLLGISGIKGAIGIGFFTDKIIEAAMKLRDNFKVDKIINIFDKK